MNESLLEFVVKQLSSRKGQWRAIAQATAVPYDTISKIARGVTTNPGVNTVQTLADYFRLQGVAA